MKIIDFFRDGKNQHLAIWVQTMAVVIGVVVALIQLQKITNQELLKSNEKYYELMNSIESDVELSIEYLGEFYRDSEKTEPNVLAAKYSSKDVEKNINNIDDSFEKISRCGLLGLCNPSLVDRYMCFYAKHMYFMQDVDYKGQKKHGMFFIPQKYEFFINDHCGFIDRLFFYMGKA